MKQKKQYNNKLLLLVLLIFILVLVAYIIDKFFFKLIEGIDDTVSEGVNNNKNKEYISIDNTNHQQKKDNNKYERIEIEPFKNDCPDKHSSGVRNNDSLDTNCKILKATRDISNNPYTIK